MKILCLGDSLTYGMGVLHKERWSSLVAEQTGYTVVNRGISGDTTGGMLARFERDVLRQRQQLALRAENRHRQVFPFFDIGAVACL